MATFTILTLLFLSIYVTATLGGATNATTQEVCWRDTISAVMYLYSYSRSRDINMQLIQQEFQYILNDDPLQFVFEVSNQTSFYENDDESYPILMLYFDVVSYSNSRKHTNQTLYDDAVKGLQAAMNSGRMASALSKTTSLSNYRVYSRSLNLASAYASEREYEACPCARAVDPIYLLFLGDWGKGGETGDRRYQSEEEEGEEEGEEEQSQTSDSRRILQEGHDGEGHEGHEGGEGSEGGGPEDGGGPEEGGDHDHEHDHEHDEHEHEHEDENVHDEHEHEEHGQEFTYQVAVAEQMASYAASVDITAVIALGDNFYDDGVQSTNDTLWTTMFTDVYIRNFTSLRKPWFAVFGNHDYGYGEEGVQAQIDRYRDSPTDDDYWTMPARNYTHIFDIDGEGEVQIVFIDSTTLAPNADHCCNEEGGVSEEEQERRIANQLSHIESMLAEAMDTGPSWLLVAGHYPIVTAGEHGDIEEMMQYLQPLLEKYHVNAYFCGHDHISEHLQYNDTEYFVAGAGALTDNLGEQGSVADLLWYGTEYSAFASVAATPDSLTVEYVDQDGNVVYNYTMTETYPQKLQRHLTASTEESMGSRDTSSDGNTQANTHSNPASPQMLVYGGVCAFVVVVILTLQVYFTSTKRNRLLVSQKMDVSTLTTKSLEMKTTTSRPSDDPGTYPVLTDTPPELDVEMAATKHASDSPKRQSRGAKTCQTTCCMEQDHGILSSSGSLSLIEATRRSLSTPGKMLRGTTAATTVLGTSGHRKSTSKELESSLLERHV